MGGELSYNSKEISEDYMPNRYTIVLSNNGDFDVDDEVRDGEDLKQMEVRDMNKQHSDRFRSAGVEDGELDAHVEGSSPIWYYYSPGLDAEIELPCASAAD